MSGDDAEDTFAELCRKADARRRAPDESIMRLRRLLEPDISLARAAAEIHDDWFHDRAAESTVEALMFSLRSGVVVLGEASTQRRLAELSDKQMREVAVRVQKFKPEIAAAWKPEDVEILITVWSKLGATGTEEDA
jgi:hypothetical protein